MKYYSSKTVTQILGVTAQTLRNWDKEGKLKPSYVKGNGYRYYSEDSILAYTQERKTKRDLNVVLYLRGNDISQQNQLESIKDYITDKYTSYEVITDDSTSIDYDRPALKKLIYLINKKEVDVIVVSHKNRLARVGLELIEYFAELNNVKIEYVNRTDKTQNEEIVDDVSTLVNDILNTLSIRNKDKVKAISNELTDNLGKLVKTK